MLCQIKYSFVLWLVNYTDILNICFQHRPRHLCLLIQNRYVKRAICKHIKHSPLKSILDVQSPTLLTLPVVVYIISGWGPCILWSQVIERSFGAEYWSGVVSLQTLTPPHNSAPLNNSAPRLHSIEYTVPKGWSTSMFGEVTALGELILSDTDTGKELIALTLFMLLCYICVMCLFLAVPWVGLRSVIEAFSGQTCFLTYSR